MEDDSGKETNGCRRPFMIMVNNRSVEYNNSEDQETAKAIEESLSIGNFQKNTMSLQMADATLSLLFLQILFKLQVIGQNRRFLAFSYCSFDHRFFEFLASEFCASNNNKGLILQFSGDCRLILTQESHKNLITSYFNRMGKLQVNVYKLIPQEYLTHCGEYLLQIQLNVSASYEPQNMQNLSALYANQYKGKVHMNHDEEQLFVHLKGDDFEQEISDIPLVPLIMSCPNVISVKFRGEPVTSSFYDRIAQEFRKRPASCCLPCKVRINSKLEPSFGLYQIDYFNQTKLTNLDLSGSDAECDSLRSPNTQQRVLDVLSQSVYLEKLEFGALWMEPSEHQNCLQFLKELRKIASRMRPFKLATILPINSGANAQKLSKIAKQIQMICQRGSNRECNAIMILVWATKLSPQRTGQFCLMRILPLDVFRELRLFLLN